MYILFTSKEVISYCLDSNFKYNSIKHLKYIKDIHLEQHEIAIKIVNNNIEVLKAHQYQDSLRVNFTLKLIQQCLSYLNDIDCSIIINTGDGCSDIEKYTRLCFSCSYNSKHIQIPDPHIFQYQSFIDTVKLEDKQDKLIFIGSDTGKLEDDLINERIRFCDNVKDLKHIYAKISNFVHFNKDMLMDVAIDIEKIKSKFVPIDQQLYYKYILNINGNTASWDRIPWAMKSNSYLINLDSRYNEYNWYYPYISHVDALEFFSIGDLRNKKYYYNKEIKDKQQNIGNIILNHDTHTEYLKEVLIRYNQEYNS